MVRKFDTGATRDSDDGKLDFDGFFSPLVLVRFAEYMHAHRRQADGQMRASDNWQNGIPLPVYRKSLWRHFVDVWKELLGIATPAGFEENACALMFNIQGALHEHLKAKANRNLPREVYVTAELAYLADFGPNKPESRHPMQAEADRVSEWGLVDGSGL